MKNFVWILDGQLFPYIKGNGGVSASYVLPKAQAPSRIEEIAGSAVWIVFRNGDGDVLFARVHITTVEQFEDGYNNGDYLLSVDLTRSCRIVRDADWAEEPRLEETRLFEKGVSEISGGVIETLATRLLNGVSINFRRPPEALLNKIDPQPISGEETEIARRWIAAVSSRFSLREVWATKSPAMPPFAHFAYLGLERAYGREKALSLVPALNAFDPTSYEPQNAEKRRSMRSPSVKGIVDTNLSPIDLNTLYARRFVAKEASAIDMEEVLEKVERAEKRHQDMLRDISAHLISMGHVPLQSSSIDLSVEIGNKLVVFELKSVNPDNLLNQSAKGSFQLFCYKLALIEDERDVSDIVLVLEKTVNEPLNEYVKSVLSQVNVRILYYDEAREWPYRLSGLNLVLRKDGN